MGSSSSSRVVLEVRIEEVIPKALSYEEARLLALARGGERRIIKLFTGGLDG